MITIAEFSNVIFSSISLIVIWAFWHFGWKEYRIERFRQDLFQLRRQLFDLAASGAISFDHPVYVGFRNALNSVIRFGHHLSLSRLIFAVWAIGVDEIKLNEVMGLLKWRKLMNSLPNEQRNPLEEIDNKMGEKILWHVVTVSPLFPLVIVPAIFLVLVSLVAASFLASLRKSLMQRLVPVVEVDAWQGDEGNLGTHTQVA